MELRRTNHLHYISAVKGGKVVKILNVTRGRPTLSFKEISTILDCSEPYDGLNTKSIPLVKRSLQKVHGLNMVKSGEEIVNDNYIGDSSDERSSDLDDIFLGEMTLRQLKKKCKAKKGGVSRLVEREVKQDSGGAHEEADGFDMEETLGSLKRKVSRNSKSRKMQKCGSGPKTTYVVKCEPISFGQDGLQVGGGIDMYATIKVEISEPDCSPCQDVSCSSDDSYSGEHAMPSTGKVIGETQGSGDCCIVEDESLFIVQGSKIPNAGPVSREHYTSANSPPPEIPVCEEMMNIDDLEIIEKVSSEFPDPGDGCSPGEQISLIAEERQVCILNQRSYEFNEYLEGVCVPPESSNHEESLKAADPIIAADLPIIMPILAQEDEDIADVLKCNESPDILFPMYGFACNDSCTTYSHENKIPIHRSMSPKPDESDDQALCMSASSDMLPVESSSDGGPCSTMDSTKEYMLPGFPGASVNSPISGLDATIKCTRALNHVNEPVPGDCSMPVMVEVDSMDDTDKVSRSFASESVELQHPPERLLSGRKAISPDSQQKLCKAMKSLDLPEYQEIEKCKQRLCFEKQEVNADASSNVGTDQVFRSSIAPEHMNTADTSPDSEWQMRRGKGDKKRVRARGANKVARPTWYRISSGCACIRTCPQNVVNFSQQQMNDVERLAVKLTKELRSMKDIMIEMLQPEARRLTTSRNNINEVRIAVENATRAEEHTRRLLDTMTKDCNRFCKIVSLAEKEAVTVGNKTDKELAENNAASTASRGRKKITFADESGGTLCDVKFIEDEQSLLDSPIENGALDACIDPIQDS